jgi:hypothetical protein
MEIPDNRLAMRRLTPAAIGLRAHSGWAALVAVAGSLDHPTVLLRRRIEIADPLVRGPFQPYHQARELELSAAAQFLSECANSTRAFARHAVQAAIDELSGCRVAGCAILLGSGRPAGTLEATVRSHPAIHTAEGEFFRAAMMHACESCGLRCGGVREKEIMHTSAAAFGDVQRRLTDLGKLIGPPWQQDQKYAALLGWLVLADRI